MSLTSEIELKEKGKAQSFKPVEQYRMAPAWPQYGLVPTVIMDNAQCTFLRVYIFFYPVQAP